MFSSLISLVSVLICVPWYTMLERKVLGYCQYRKGPAKVGYAGLIQPLADAVKLLFKGGLWKFARGNLVILWFSPLFSFLMMLLCWVLYPLVHRVSVIYPLSLILLLCWLGAGVYAVMLAGWGRKTKYRILGRMRAVAQRVSYEVSLLTSVFLPILVFSSLKIREWRFLVGYIVCFFLFFVLLILFACETKRSPFDFAEGESELVSGFKVDYSAFPFALFFLAEYGRMLFASVFIILVFGSSILVFNLFFAVLLTTYFIILRASLPRYRYDSLMLLCWAVLLILSLRVLFYFSWL